jgi:Bacterial PH domain
VLLALTTFQFAALRVVIVAALFVLVVAILLASILLRDEDKGLKDFVGDIFRSPYRELKDNLGGHETVLLYKRPAITAFLWRERRLAAQTFFFALLWLLFAKVLGLGHSFALGLFLVFDGHILYVFYRRLEDIYTLYVFTNQRVMRLSGVFNRDQASIDWHQIVDTSWQQSFLGRLLGYATLRVDSASEKARPVRRQPSHR